MKMRFVLGQPYPRIKGTCTQSRGWEGSTDGVDTEKNLFLYRVDGPSIADVVLSRLQKTKRTANDGCKDLESGGKSLFHCTIPSFAKRVEEILHGIHGNQNKI
jgi:hypothetical protein